MKKAVYFIIITTAIITILIVGKGILIPFIFALLFWLLTREIRKYIYKIPLTKKLIPVWLNNILVVGIIILVFGFLSKILTKSISDVTLSYSKYEPNIEMIFNRFSNYLSPDIIDYIKSSIGDLNYGSILGTIANSISGLLGNTFMIVIYAIFLLLEEASFTKKLKNIFVDKSNYNNTLSLITKIEDSISNYLYLKTFVSLLTGVLSYIVLSIVGVDSAPFWAFLIFLLNYIPTVGSLIGTLFPAIFCLIQFGEISTFFIVLISVGTIQVIVGNIIEPRIFGKSLNLSPLVTITSLALWGKIWGITGMILSVPITVIMIIIFSQFKSTRTIAIILSENGDIEDNKK